MKRTNKRGRKTAASYAIGKRKGIFYRRKKRYKGKQVLIWDLYFPKQTSPHEVDEIVSTMNPPIKKFPIRGGIDRTQVKIIIVTRKGSAVSYIYKDLWDVFDINLSILDALYRTFFTPKTKQSKSERQVHGSSISRITVDFESSV